MPSTYSSGLSPVIAALDLGSTASSHGSTPLNSTQHLDLIRRADKMRIPLFTPREDIEVWLKRYDAITQRTGLSNSLKAEYLVNFVRNDVAEYITTSPLK
ncbi:hypothetical protein Unana1_01646 [Umbelopsis nana]